MNKTAGSPKGLVSLYTLKRFDSLQQLIMSTQKTLYDGFYLIDRSGQILAGPQETLDDMSEAQKHLSDKDLALFQSLKPRRA
jgi:hypothetical protein